VAADGFIDLSRVAAPGPARRLARPRIRPGADVLLAVGVLVLAGLTGARPASGSLQPLATVSANSPAVVVLTEDTMYLGDDRIRDGVISAHELPGGRLRWRVRLAGAVRAIIRVPQAGVLLVGLAGRDAERVVAVTAATGQVRWRRSATTVLDAPPGERVLLRHEDVGSLAQLQWIDARTGEVIWSRAIPPAATATVLGHGLLVLQRGGAGVGSLTAFDAATLARRWSLSGNLLGSPLWCGGLICLGTGQGIRAVDPGSGTVHWHSPGWQYASSLPSDRLLGYGIDGGLAVLDARTGATLRVVANGPTRVMPGGGSAPWLSQPAGAGGRYAFWRLGSNPEVVRWVGYLSGIDGQSCLVAGDLLACQTTVNQVRVWRYRP
jgi:outer membrane protein assembly factor BamB